MTLHLHPLNPYSPDFSLKAATIQIGRANDNQLVVTDPQVSRHHALIQWQGEHLVLADLNSTGGTFVNDVRLTQSHQLRLDDTIKIGNCVWRVIETASDASINVRPPVYAEHPGANDATVAQAHNPVTKSRSRLGGCVGRVAKLSFLLLLVGVVGMCLTMSILWASARNDVATANATLMALAATPGKLKSVSSNYVLFISNHNGFDDIYLFVINQPGVTQLTHSDNAVEPYAALSPDKSRIAFTMEQGGNRELFVMKVDGSDVIQLTHSPANEDVVSWSPDGTQLVFNAVVGISPDAPTNLYVLDLGSLALKQLTFTGADKWPTWSPVGDWIVYVCGADICRIKADGSTSTLIVRDARSASSPTWSPDAQKILYFCGNRLCVSAPDGTDQKTLLGSDVRKWWPVWLPDRRIIFYATASGGSTELMIMNDDGSNLSQLTDVSP